MDMVRSVATLLAGEVLPLLIGVEFNWLGELTTRTERWRALGESRAARALLVLVVVLMMELRGLQLGSCIEARCCGGEVARLEAELVAESLVDLTKTRRVVRGESVMPGRRSGGSPNRVRILVTSCLAGQGRQGLSGEGRSG